MTQAIVVAGLWARPLAESARQAGWRVIALDLFGDADTRRACIEWRRIGDPASFTIDPVLLRDALHAAAREQGVIGWVAGSGFEGLPDLLEMVVPGLPLLGMTGPAVRRLRHPAVFFAVLDVLRLAHPEVALVAPVDPHGWLVKSAVGAGGWHVRLADEAAPVEPGDYWQRFEPGAPMSALFLADGHRARTIALNRLLVAPQGLRPFVFAGALGPIRDDDLARHIEAALAALVPAFGLRGLASLDFIARDDRVSLLEINPRPSASMVLHAQAWPGGLLRAHVAAGHGALPADAPHHASGVRGWRTVFADRPCRVGPRLARDLARADDCHDLPAADAAFGAGEPVCSVGAQGATAEAVQAALELRVAGILDRLARPQELAA